MAWWNTFYNTGGGGDITILKVAPFYQVAYVPTEPEEIQYVRPQLQKISYIKDTTKIKVSYVKDSSIAVIQYRKQNVIKIKLICQ